MLVLALLTQSDQAMDNEIVSTISEYIEISGRNYISII